MKTIYVDRLSLFSLAALLTWKRGNTHIYYFNASSGIRKLSAMFVLFGLLKTVPQPVDFILSDLQDEIHGSLFPKITMDTVAICKKIGNKEVTDNKALLAFGRHFDRNKMNLFFHKVIESEIAEPVVFINVAPWHAQRELGVGPEKIGFFMERGLWADYLLEYATVFGMNADKYMSVQFQSAVKLFKQIKKRLLSISVRLLSAKTNIDRSAKKAEDNAAYQNTGRISLVSAQYTGRQTTFSLKKRTEFFWFLRSDIPRERILFYFEKPNYPATHEIVKGMKKEKLRFVSLSNKLILTEDVSVWSSTGGAKQERNLLIKALIKTYFINLLKMDPLPLFYITHLGYFIVKYSYWHDFFKRNNIKININTNLFPKSNIPMNTALEKNGGISITFQYSNCYNTSYGQSNYSDVFFSFGPEYKREFENNGSIINNIIYSGYVTDYSFNEVKKNSSLLRESLHKKGSRFIICYFDENSSDDRMSVVPNSMSAYIYKKLFEYLLSNETIGLICSPKFPTTLMARLPGIKELMDKARDTGRFVLASGFPHTDNYPSEAAQAADLCISILFGGTTALESFLSGTPTVLLDLEKLYSYPIYEYGKEKVVFDDIDKLLSAIEKYRDDPESIPGFGDLSRWAEGKDPFRDGNASLRIGQYINWLINEFDKEKNRDKAIEYANTRYAELWGKENIIDGIK